MCTIQPMQNINIGKVCRACFEICEQYKMLYESAETTDHRTLGDIFFDVVKIETKTDIESSPSRICIPCSQDLVSAYNFIKTSQQNEDRLRDYFKSSSIIQPDCLSEFPIDIPNQPNVADALQIKVENELINEYVEPPPEDNNPPPSSSESAESEGNDYEDEAPLHKESKINKMQCTYCGRIFKRLDFLENHKRKHEEELNKKEESGEDTSTLICDECGINCDSKLELKTHRLTEHPPNRTISSERENSESSAIQNKTINKCDHGCSRPPTVERWYKKKMSVHRGSEQTVSKDTTDILMLKLEMSNLRETCLKEFSEIKALIRQQSNTITKERDHKDVIEKSDEVVTQMPVWKFDKIFPINSEEELNALNSIDENQKLIAIGTVRQLIYHGGLCQNMNRIFGNNIIVNYNYEGKRGKKSLKDLINVNEILFRATFKNGYTMENYESDLLKGFKIMKNRYFKNECIKRKKSDVNPDSKNMFIEMNRARSSKEKS